MKFTSHVPAHTSPLVSTVICCGAELAQVGVKLVSAFEFMSSTVAVRVTTSPGFKEIVVGVTAIVFGCPLIVEGAVCTATPPHPKMTEHRIERAAR